MPESLVLAHRQDLLCQVGVVPNSGPVPEVCFLDGMGGGPISEEKGAGPERVVMRHLIRGGGGLVLCGVEDPGGAGWQLRDTFPICPAGGVVPFLGGTVVPRTSTAQEHTCPYSPTTL